MVNAPLTLAQTRQARATQQGPSIPTSMQRPLTVFETAVSKRTGLTSKADIFKFVQAEGEYKSNVAAEQARYEKELDAYNVELAKFSPEEAPEQYVQKAYETAYSKIQSQAQIYQDRIAMAEAAINKVQEIAMRDKTPVDYNFIDRKNADIYEASKVLQAYKSQLSQPRNVLITNFYTGTTEQQVSYAANLAQASQARLEAARATTPEQRALLGLMPNVTPSYSEYQDRVTREQNEAAYYANVAARPNLFSERQIQQGITQGYLQRLEVKKETPIQQQSQESKVFNNNFIGPTPSGEFKPMVLRQSLWSSTKQSAKLLLYDIGQSLGDKKYKNPLEPFNYAVKTPAEKVVANPYYLSPTKSTINTLFDFKSVKTATREDIQSYEKVIGSGYYVNKDLSKRDVSKTISKTLETGAVAAVSFIGPVGLGLASLYAVGSGIKTVGPAFNQELSTGQRLKAAGLGTFQIGLGLVGVRSSINAVGNEITTLRFQELMQKQSKTNYKGTREQLGSGISKDVLRKEVAMPYANLQSNVKTINYQAVENEINRFTSFGTSNTRVKVMDWMTGKPITINQQSLLFARGKELSKIGETSNVGGRQGEIILTKSTISPTARGYKVRLEVFPEGFSSSQFKIGGRGTQVNEVLFSQSGKASGIYIKKGVGLMDGSLYSTSRYGLKIKNPSGAIVKIKPEKVESLGKGIFFQTESKSGLTSINEITKQTTKTSSLPSLTPFKTIGLPIQTRNKVISSTISSTQATKLKQSSDLSSKQIQTQAFVLVPKQQVKTTQEQQQKLKEITKVIPSLSLISDVTTRQTPVQTIMPITIPKLNTPTKTTTRPVTTTTFTFIGEPSIPIPRHRDIPNPFVFNPKKSKKSVKKVGRAYRTYILKDSTKPTKRWALIGSELPLVTALSIGAEATTKDISRRFKVVPEGENVAPKNIVVKTFERLAPMFRSFSQKGGVKVGLPKGEFIQLSKSSLSSRGEQRQIQSARRNKMSARLY